MTAGAIYAAIKATLFIPLPSSCPSDHLTKENEYKISLYEQIRCLKFVKRNKECRSGKIWMK